MKNEQYFSFKERLFLIIELCLNLNAKTGKFLKRRSPPKEGLIFCSV
jgi:hypothetical protein